MTSIQWTNETWNPVTGCSKVSQGCKNCYAERIWKKVYGSRPFNDVRCHEDRLVKPHTWKTPRMVFVNSMSDLFHEDVPFKFVWEVFTVMASCPRHTFQILTKRPARMAAFFAWMFNDNQVDYFSRPLPNVWIGVSIEDQKTLDDRMEYLVNIPAAVRWISAEPLLESINAEFWLNPGHNNILDWVVVGGESGVKGKVRPFDLRWVYELKRQCSDAGVPLFVKQFGRNPIFSGGDGDAASHPMKFKDWHGGTISEWPEDLRIREFPR